MAEVTGMTAEAIDQLMGEMVTSMRIDENGQMLYKTRDGGEFNAGPIVAPAITVDKAWPVGSLYIGTTPENPATVLGVGTWSRYGKGKTLVSLDENQTEFNAVDKTGGSKTITLAVTNLPAHYHSMNHDHPSASVQIRYADNAQGGGDTMKVTDVGGATGGGGSSKAASINIPAYSGSTGSTGSATPVASLNPYIVVYVWRRTA